MHPQVFELVVVFFVFFFDLKERNKKTLPQERKANRRSRLEVEKARHAISILRLVQVLTPVFLIPVSLFPTLLIAFVCVCVCYIEQFE
jgi:Na+/H+ antiporter NhaD/arsenite permease-like protein